MKPLDMLALYDFVEHEIETFHAARLQSLQSLDIKALVRRKNPYLARAKNVTLAHELVAYYVEGYLSASEEEHFGHFIEKLALFVVAQTCEMLPHAFAGIDSVFLRDGVCVVLQVKSGPHWGNADQQRRLRANFEKARAEIAAQYAAFQAVLGIAYGKRRTPPNELFTTLIGQQFWAFISDDANLYVDIVQPIGHQAREKNHAFQLIRDQIINKLVQTVLNNYTVNGQIDWQKLLTENSGD